ncbi:capsid protein [Roseobacter phage CRP-403]|uniref:Capsid protein n=1 Tax=Roseobacter phage CRP-403 TaxID=3072849 RepID=A0AAX3ZXG5_9CAUD|nr:capsid protein [Roseobacter phage CRP-403]
MSNATPSRLGQAGLMGDTNALFLKVFSGEVMSTFNANTVMKEKTRIRSIQNGKSAQFPAIGKTVAEYHSAGAEILGNTVEHGEKVITIDDMLISHTFIANIDEAKNHYDVRAEYSKQMGQALAQTYDRNLLSMAVKAARDATGLGLGVAGQGNASSENLGSLTPSTADIVTGIYDAAATLDERNVPETERFVIVSPTVYYALVQNDKLINRDFGQNGSYSDGTIMRVAGMQIVKSNNMAVDHTTATATYPDFNSKYAVDASDTSALVIQRQALGTVQLMDMATEMEYDIRRQGTLAVSKMAVGHGVLRPECIIELRAAV